MHDYNTSNLLKFLMSVMMTVNWRLIALSVLVFSFDFVHGQNGGLLNSCNGTGGLTCSDNGVCSEGVCHCYPGHSGPVCENDFVLSDDGVSTTTDSLAADPTQSCPKLNGQICNGHGQCIDGNCICDVRWSGEACELMRTTGFCNVYRQCAECMAFGSKCAENCNTKADFRLVEVLPSSAMDNIFHRCRYKSFVHRCSFYYQLGKEIAGRKTILVKPCPEWLIALKEFSSKGQVAKDGLPGSVTSATLSAFLLFMCLIFAKVCL